jgi:hypothetical protein
VTLNRRAVVARCNPLHLDQRRAAVIWPFFPLPSASAWPHARLRLDEHAPNVPRLSSKRLPSSRRSRGPGWSNPSEVAAAEDSQTCRPAGRRQSIHGRRNGALVDAREGGSSLHTISETIQSRCHPFNRTRDPSSDEKRLGRTMQLPSTQSCDIGRSVGCVQSPGKKWGLLVYLSVAHRRDQPISARGLIPKSPAHVACANPCVAIHYSVASRLVGKS